MKRAEVLESLARSLDVARVLKEFPELKRVDLRRLLKEAASVMEEREKKSSTEFSTLRLYTDGASRGNPGPAGIGVVIQDEADRTIEEIRRYLGVTTNNVAEYTALIDGLEAVRKYGPGRVEVYSDSELVIKQMRGEYHVRNTHLIRLHQRAKALARAFEKVAFHAIPREMNQMADALANEAIDQEFISVPKSIR